MVKLMTFLLSPLGKALGLLAVISAVLGYVYLQGLNNARDEFDKVVLEGNLSTMQDAFNKDRAARLQDSILAEEADKRSQQLQQKIEDLEAYAKALEDRDRVCLDDTDVDRLRSLWD